MTTREESAKQSLITLAHDMQLSQAELDQRNQEKEHMSKIVHDIKKEIAYLKAKAQKMSLSNDKMVIQIQEMSDRVQHTRPEDIAVENEIRQIKHELVQITQENEDYAAEVDQLKTEITRRQNQIDDINVIISRAQRELQLQMKERDRYKQEAIATAKYAATLYNKVQEWTEANENFVLNIQPQHSSDQNYSRVYNNNNNNR
eukprot:TRINITY_DN2637_c0_g1_i1.p1 TRINITY_DN2637_c0_g1~~TRINITY_DN2637_c0_g1_i1.p1  ORF type:complete len:202 (-),score=61.47 TRINITY_DN2637_c0_g1_i1:18-623(-)